MVKNENLAIKERMVSKDAALKESFAAIREAAKSGNTGIDGTVTPGFMNVGSEDNKLPEPPQNAAAQENISKFDEPSLIQDTDEHKQENQEKECQTITDSSIVFEFLFQGVKKQINTEDIRHTAIEQAKAVKPNVNKVDIYVVADQCAAYYVIDGEGSPEYKISL